jgi:hypothetical protein
MKLHEIAPHLEPHPDIRQWLDQYEIKNYTIRPDGIVDVKGDVDLPNFRETTIPIQFGTVTGAFDSQASGITSLKGVPQLVGQMFTCSDTKIISLMGAPQHVGGEFYCHDTKITSLAGCPKHVGGLFDCRSTQIRSFSGVDKIIKYIGGDFYYSGKQAYLPTHLLGLLLIKGITRFHIDTGGPIDKIMNRYVGTGDILSAQDELIDAGFTDQARL